MAKSRGENGLKYGNINWKDGPYQNPVCSISKYREEAIIRFKPTARPYVHLILDVRDWQSYQRGVKQVTSGMINQ